MSFNYSQDGRNDNKIVDNIINFFWRKLEE